MSFGRTMLYFKGHQKAAGACQKQHSPIIDKTPTHALFIQHYITPATCIAATTPELTVGILNSVF